MSEAPGIPESELSRRSVVKWLLLAASAAQLAPLRSFGSPEPLVAGAAVGYGPDPDLLRDYIPGQLWPLTFDAPQRRSAATLCDMIIPADGTSPSASALKVESFIDEWISAPYPHHELDRRTVVEGLAWLDTEAQKRFSANFSDLIFAQKAAICDDICAETRAKPERRKAVRFFAKFRDLTASGYYTTPEGMQAIGYVGNVPLATFDGPPPEVLARLGLDSSS